MLTGWVMVAAGGAAGALLRYGAGAAVARTFGTAFPWGTLIVNVSGCFAMGLLYVLLAERAALPAEWRLGLMVGVLGAYTTFSSFSIETLVLLEGGLWWRAAANALASLVLCLAACAAGLALARHL